MYYGSIYTPEQMIDYMIDCTLATVEHYLNAKKINKSEFERQCSIAQKGINFLGKNYPFTSRAQDFAKNSTAFEYYSKIRNERISK